MALDRTSEHCPFVYGSLGAPGLQAVSDAVNLAPKGIDLFVKPVVRPEPYGNDHAFRLHKRRITLIICHNHTMIFDLFDARLGEDRYVLQSELAEKDLPGHALQGFRGLGQDFHNGDNTTGL